MTLNPIGVKYNYSKEVKHLTQQEIERKAQGTRMRLIREGQNLTQTEMAIKIGISLSFIRQVETGNKQVSINLAKTYALWFNTSLDYIYFGKVAK